MKSQFQGISGGRGEPSRSAGVVLTRLKASVELCCPQAVTSGRLAARHVEVHGHVNRRIGTSRPIREPAILKLGYVMEDFRRLLPGKGFSAFLRVICEQDQRDEYLCSYF